MAAGNSIAKANVLITTNADQVASGLNKVGKDVEKWGGGAGKAAGGKAGAGVGGGMFAGLGKATPYIAAATIAVGGFVAVGDKLFDTLNDLGRMDQVSQAMGLTAEQFTGMAGVAKSVGEDTREFIESLVTMGKLGTDAAKGTERAAEAMNGLGINVEEFNKLRADEQFYQIFDKLGKVQEPLQRTRYLMQAFGEDGGKYLLPLLAKTPEQIRKMGDSFAISGEQMKKASAASQSLREIEMVGTKLWRNLATTAAPFITKIANMGMRLMDGLKPFFDWIGRMWETTERIGTAFAGAIEDAIGGAFNWIREQSSGLFDWVDQIPSIESVTTGFFRAMGLGAAYAWDSIKLGAGAIAATAGAIIRGFGAIVDAIKDVVSLARELPDDIRPKELDAFIAGVDKFSGDVNATGQKLTDWGAGTFANFGQSAADFDKWFANVLKKKEKMEEPLKAPLAAEAKGIVSDPLKFSAAIAQGSKEAYEMTIKNQYRELMGENDTQKKQLKEQKETKKAVKDGNKKLDGIADAVKGIGTF